MPIRPENKDKYPGNWGEIVDAVRERSGDRCEGCGLKNGISGYRDIFGQFHEIIPSDLEGMLSDGCHLITIVLTTAHLDHNPENSDMNNLRHYCQKCHNGHDAPIRAAGIRRRRRQNQEKTQIALEL